MEKICKSTAQPMENRVSTFFFFFLETTNGKILLDMVASKKKKKVNMGRTLLLQIFSALTVNFLQLQKYRTILSLIKDKDREFK